MFIYQSIRASLLSFVLCIGFSGTAIAVTKREGSDDLTKSQRIAGLVRGMPLHLYDGFKGFLGEEAFKLNYTFDKEGRKALRQIRLRDQKYSKSDLRVLIRGSEVTSGKGQVILLGETNILGDMPKETALKVVQDALKERHSDTVYVVDSASPLYPLMKEAAAGKIDEADIDPAAGGVGGGGGGGGALPASGDVEETDAASHAASGKPLVTSILEVKGFYEFAKNKLVAMGVSKFIAKAVLSHILSSYKIFGDKPSLDKEALWNVLEETLKITTKVQSYGTLDKAIEEENNEGERLIQNIVIRDDLLEGNKEALNAYFGRNPTHKLVLDVGHELALGDPLVLRKGQIPENLKHLAITNVAGNVTTIGGLFLYGCSGLLELNLNPLANVTTIGGLFLNGCSGLLELNLNPLANVTIIEGGFLNGCSGLLELNLKPLANVTTIGNGFLNGCSGLLELNLKPLANVTSIGNRFLYGCSGLLELNLKPLANVTTIGGEFLSHCGNLTALDLKLLANVTTIGWHFLFHITELEDLRAFIKEAGGPVAYIRSLHASNGASVSGGGGGGSA